MNTSKQDTRFLQLLHKWRTGDFTRADEQELWALASGDPFRMDALEGMLEQPELDHAAVVTALRARIRDKQPGRRVGFPQILAVAAGLALVFAAIWFFNLQPLPSENGQMATELHGEGETPPELVAPSVTAPSTPTEMRAKSAPAGGGPASPAAPEAGKIAENEAATAIVETKDDRRAEEALSDVALQEPSRSIAQPPGAISEQSTNVARPAERAKEESNYAKKKLSKDPAPVMERQQSRQQNAGNAKADLPAQSNQPKEGWDSFRKRLANDAHLTPAALANNVTGTVRLQFSLNKRSQPIDFKVINSLGHGCDEAAIQLVKITEWIKVNDQPITVDVPFVR